MTQTEYEHKKRECWEEFCKEHPLDATANGGVAFRYAFDRAYALGKQFGNSEQVDIEESHVQAKKGKGADTVISGWVARDGNGPNDLGLRVYSVKPKRMEGLKRWNGHGEKSTLIDSRLFPDLTWSDAPIECEIIIKKKKNG